MVGKAFFENLGESLNPVFIKEMRQYFQNRRMVLLMGGLLLVEFICTLFFSSAAARKYCRLRKFMNGFLSPDSRLSSSRIKN